MPNVFATPDDCDSPLGKRMQQRRADRPDEWLMDEFIREVERMYAAIEERDKALCDLLDGERWHDIQENTGLPEERCKEIASMKRFE